MNFLHDGKQFRIEFTHDLHQPALAYETQYRGTKLIQATTTCVVHERDLGAPPEAEVVYVVGHSRCSIEDRFVKSDARERAVRRAADAASDRAIRGKILAAYFTRPRGYQKAA